MKTPQSNPTFLDWMGLVTIVLQAAVLGFSRMYTSLITETFLEFQSDLGFLTTLVLSPLYGAACALLILMCGSALWWPSLKGQMATKRLFLMIGFMFGMLSIGLYVIGLYIPIFELAGNVAQ